VAWLLPELDVGLEPELKPLEPVELEFELEPEDVEPDEPEPDEPELDDPEFDDPEFDDPKFDDPEFDEPELDVPDEPDDTEEGVLALWVDPGRARATTPAAATLAKVTVVVVERTLARPCSLAAMARWMPSRCVLLMEPILRLRTRSRLYELSPLAMRRAGRSVARRGGYPRNMRIS
jgi:hypothetical protein